MIKIVPAAWPLSGLRVLTTRSAGGVSTGPYASLNLASHVGDRIEDVFANRAYLARQWNLPSDPRWLNQVHGSRVVDAAAVGGDPPTADGSFTVAPQVVCAVLTADCLPIVLADRRSRCVATLHGGWRGLAAGIIEAGVNALPVPASALVAWLGPAIGPAHYEVGEEVRAAFGAAAACAFRSLGRGHYQADLYALARLRLQAAGVTEIYGGGLCTLTDPLLFSYRRSPVCGRMATLAWLL
ncbi:MAG TPA: peptidoglycan editing factor PgeF [Acidiferrobacter sp.]|nr:peptidoglycan editing factor PgeF [Acidiferrobacter sp.]